ncbi:neprilysin-2-like [Amblyomma americanum]
MKSHRLLTTRIFKEQATENFTLSSVNAYYLGSRNTITIYPGLLQPPFFFKGAPAAINYGGLGQVVGHEIMHAFDADGITYSYRYIRRNFDDTMTMKEYKKKLLCIRASYERAEASLSRARTSERDTDSEGFADFAGAVLAYATYRRLPEHVRTRSLPDVGLSAEQTFFVSRCLNLCSTTPGRRRTPGSKYWHSRSRCIVPLQNMPEFSKAFSCKPGDLMNPPDRCSFW